MEWKLTSKALDTYIHFDIETGGNSEIAYWLHIERSSNDCRKTKAKAITPTNHNRSRQRDEPTTILSNILVTRSKRGKNHAYMVRLVLVLILIGWKTGASLLSQSLSVAIEITELISTAIWKLL